MGRLTERQAAELFVYTMIRQVRESWPGLFSEMRTLSSVVDLERLDQEDAQWEMILAASALDLSALKSLFSKAQAERLLTLTIQCFPEEERAYALSTINEYHDRYDKDLASGLNPMLAIGEILYGRWGLPGDCYRPGELFIAPDQIFAAGLAVPLPSFVGVWKRIKTNYSLTAD